MDLVGIDVPDWLGPVLWWAKWIVIAGVIFIAGIAERAKNRSRG